MSTEVAAIKAPVSSNRATAAALLMIFGACLFPITVIADAFPAELSLADVEPANGGDGSVGVYLFGATGNDEKGKSVASTGDFDGDGLADVLIGAPGAGSCQNCAAYIAFGGTALPPSIDLLHDPDDSNGADAFIFRSLAPDDLGGQSISDVGDVNGDGIADFMIGAPQAEPNGAASGRAYVVFGRSTGYPPVFDGQTLMPANGGDGSEGFVLNGIASDDQSGYAVTGGCDLNNDGVHDLVVGGANSEADKAHVVFGRTSGFAAVFELASLLPANGGDGSAGFEIDGLSNGEIVGNAVGCLGDVNGDGIDDLAVGAVGGKNKTDPSGTVYLLFGRNGGFPPVFNVSDLLAAGGGDGSDGAVLHGIANGDDTGAAVSDAGDVNDDGVDDIIVGAPHADSSNGHDSGRIYVVYGRSNGFPAEWNIADLLSTNGGDGSEGTVFNGIADGDWAGVAVSGAGDVNGDRVSDLIIGAPSAHIPGMHTGVSYVVFGRGGGYAAEFELSSLVAVNGGDGSQGFLLLGATASDISGTAVSGGGDVNGDGIDDLLIGAPGLNLHRDLVGKAYLVYGRPLDTDGDEVPDGSDNCTTVANEDQRDTDDDGIGNACDADFNGDCDTNFLDLGIMKQVFFKPGTTDTDMNGDGETNFLDLGMLKAGFFMPPGPSGIPNICMPRPRG